MRFAAAQIPAKIGTLSLNGENLHRFTPFRAASDSSPFCTLVRTDFFTPPFARRRATSGSRRISENDGFRASPRRGDILIGGGFDRLNHRGCLSLSKAPAARAAGTEENHNSCRGRENKTTFFRYILFFHEFRPKQPSAPVLRTAA